LVWTAVVANKKPTTVSSRGLLSKTLLSATRPSGSAVYYYDGYQRQGYNDLRRSGHCPQKLSAQHARVKR
jgi:hypothetical protein